ncbi:hypothetical protein C0J52_28282 [Blattella germanica]|nr:hypothetical protein C0J52_28282 [Blattella germanica]
MRRKEATASFLGPSGTVWISYLHILPSVRSKISISCRFLNFLLSSVFVGMYAVVPVPCPFMYVPFFARASAC